MNITVFGLGYVGLTNAAYLAQFHLVWGFDKDIAKIQDLRNQVDYLNEPGVFPLIKKHRKHLFYVEDPSPTLRQSDVALIAVPTPEGDAGQIDLSSIKEAFAHILESAKKGILVIIRSTVLPGTYELLFEEAKQKNREDIQLIIMPEFLSQGEALKNIISPNRVVLGLKQVGLKKTVQNMFKYSSTVPFLTTDPSSACLTKYASNSFLASKVSFINEISQIAEAVGANIQDVVKGMGYDPRIGNQFIQPGIGFGGSCFPKDLKALQYLAVKNQIKGNMIDATIAINQEQITRFMNRVMSRFNHQIKQKKIAVLGLSYKGSTTDVRNSPAFKVIDTLADQQAIIFAYDKKATFEFFNQRGEKPCLAYAIEIEDALKDADVAIILNDAKEIKNLKPNDFVRLMKTPIVFDGRNLYDVKNMNGVEYHSIGRPTLK
ncbi:MAG: UDP-glucose/GDP-mannose dehydrogenase family protein [Firmicutes bacterium]|nr:UDP-glucose/GDP-mannose dehydrogenase family protein [Bacillota bacterium]